MTHKKKGLTHKIWSWDLILIFLLADEPWENLLKTWSLPLWWEWTGNRVRLSVLWIKGTNFYLYFEKEVFFLLWKCIDLLEQWNLMSRDPDIASVLEKSTDQSIEVGNEVACVMCEMAVVWAQNRLRKNDTESQIKDKLNQVHIIQRSSVDSWTLIGI